MTTSTTPVDATIRVWDLPTRLFHWLLVLCFIGAFVTVKIGGNAMLWHQRCGYAIGALLLFRLLWGVAGGYWSRFGQLALSPRRVLGYVGGRPDVRDDVGHSPTGAWAVLAMLVLLAAQVLSGLMSDDEIAFAGPLARFVSGATTGQATYYHAHIGQWLLLGLIGLHIAAIVFYIVRLKKPLVRPMIHGDKQLAGASIAPTPPASRDTAGSRLVALVLALVCAGVMWWVSGL
ncbi:cytochrome b/b6 domain-containing protein [Comamonas testosteroni]